LHNTNTGTLKKKTRQDIIDLFKKRFAEEVVSEEMLPPSGSYREYIRLKSDHFKAIGTWNEDEKENRAFIEFSQHFKAKGIRVPEIFDIDLTKGIYLQEDLGDLTLFQLLSEVRQVEGFSQEIVELYRKVISELPKIQILAGKDINYDFCYPRKYFDRQSMMWDLNYFKYYFLKLAKIPFNEQMLEDDFTSFTDYLLKAESSFFMFRDFQSRNIMIRDDEPWFIDYQGGRQGPLQYDLASLLFDGKADIPQHIREDLLEVYLNELDTIHPVDRIVFMQYFYGFVLIRIMQAMGAYGFRGFYEKKEHFLKSIPFALENLNVVLSKVDFPVAMPELIKVLRSLQKSEYLHKIASKETKLTVLITSFSFKKGIPNDPSGNGGGFVFDCRALNNPGKFDEYKTVNGKDETVIKFFEEGGEMESFLNPIFTLVDRSVEKYLEWSFTHLMVSFGCTGGQHRSVYTAERMASHLRNKYPVKVVIQHREQENL
jgi:aminoglycoside/choline kinase family phosphotransferase